MASKAARRGCRHSPVTLVVLLVAAVTALGQTQPHQTGRTVKHTRSTRGQRPVLRDVQWSVGDSTVSAVLHFDRTPARYAAYALEDPHRIVIDCYDTKAGMLLDPEAPRPVARARLTGEAVGDEISFLRLVLFTERAIAFETEETNSAVRVVMRWNTHAEHERYRQLRRRRFRAFSIIAGTAIVGATVGIILGTADWDDEPGHTDPGSGTIPPPDMPPPLGSTTGTQ